MIREEGKTIRGRKKTSRKRSEGAWRHRSDNLIINHGLTFNGCVYKDHGNRYLWEAIVNLFAYITVFCQTVILIIPKYVLIYIF